ncbi:MAG: hypothetical protein ACM3KM_00350 [Acidobacteriaceae bacterium]
MRLFRILRKNKNARLGAIAIFLFLAGSALLVDFKFFSGAQAARNPENQRLRPQAISDSTAAQTSENQSSNQSLSPVSADKNPGKAFGLKEKAGTVPVSSPTPPVPSVAASPSAVANAAQSETGSSQTITGIVMAKYSNNNFLLNIGAKNYTVVMDAFGGTRVINSRGSLAPWQFIQVGNSVTVTGILSGMSIDAQTVLIPTTKDRGA